MFFKLLTEILPTTLFFYILLVILKMASFDYFFLMIAIILDLIRYVLHYAN